MIPNERKSEEFFSNAETGSEFVIHQNAAMFSMLSDGLYSDKVGAIVRELACNAYDSHIEAGCESTPIEITVPTTFTHEFSVEDFGVGMDEETVRSVFAGYFNSSKRNNNDVTGAFGLGSKTPFIFNDTFTVRARKDGIERVFTAYLKDGIPRLSKSSENATQESDGVKISCPVSPDNSTRFIEAVEDKLRWFRVTPKVVNADIEIENECADLEDGCIRKIDNNGYRIIEVLMGNVVYPVFMKDLYIPNDDDYKFSHWILKVPMGSVSITPSRESLSLDDDTIKTVREIFISAYRKHVDGKWSEIIRSSYMSEAQCIFYEALKLNVNTGFNTAISSWDRLPKSSYGHHKLLQNINNTSIKKGSYTFWAIINHYMNDLVDTSNFKAVPKLFQRNDIFITNVNVFNNTQHAIPKECVIDDLTRTPVFPIYKARRVHIVSHETDTTKSTQHVKVLKSLVKTKDLKLGVCNNDVVAYLPFVVDDAVKARIAKLVGRTGIAKSNIKYHSLEKLRADTPKIKRSRKTLSDEERNSTGVNISTHLITAADVRCNVSSHVVSCNLNNSDVLYLTIEKSMVETIDRYTEFSKTWGCVIKLAKMLACESGDNRSIMVIERHGNNSKRIDSCGIQSLESYVTNGINSNMKTKVGRKRLHRIGEYIAISLLKGSGCMVDYEIAYTKAISEGNPRGEIAKVYKKASKLIDVYNDHRNNYDDIILINFDIEGFIAKLNEMGLNEWCDLLSEQINPMNVITHTISGVNDFIKYGVNLPEINAYSYRAIELNEARNILKIVKNSAKMLESMYEDYII